MRHHVLPPHMHTPVIKPVHRRPLGIFAAIILGIFLTLALFHVTGIYSILDAYIHWQLIQNLEKAGLGGVSFEKLKYKNGVLNLEGIYIPHVETSHPSTATEGHAHELQIRSAKITAKLTELSHLRFQKIEAEGVGLLIHLSNNGMLNLGQLDTFIAKTQETMTFHFQELTLKDSHINCYTPLGQVTVPFEATFQKMEDKPEILIGKIKTTGVLTTEGTLQLQKRDSHILAEANLELLNIDTPDFQCENKNAVLSCSLDANQVPHFQLSTDTQTLTSKHYGSLKQPIHTTLKMDGALQDLSVNLQLQHPQATLSLDGKLDVVSAKGQLHLASSLHPVAQIVDFSPMGLQHLDGHINAKGDIIFEGEWTAAKSPIELEVKDVVFKLPNLEIEGLKGHINLTNFKPFVTKAPQTIHADKILCGQIPLTQNMLTFVLSPLGAFSLIEFTCKMFAGAAHVHNFRYLGKALHEGVAFDLSFKDIELGELFKLTNIKNLSASAPIKGHASFIWSNQGLQVERAELNSTTSKGLIQYNQDIDLQGTANEGAKLAFEVLKNLHFTSLEATITPEQTEKKTLQAQVKILGLNPAVLNGRTFEFNVKTSGELGELVRNTLQNMGQPRDIKEVTKLLKASKDKAKH